MRWLLEVADGGVLGRSWWTIEGEEEGHRARRPWVWTLKPTGSVHQTGHGRLTVDSGSAGGWYSRDWLRLK
jgi:hypothetical protein